MEISSSSFIPLNPGLYSAKERWNPSQIGYQVESHTHDTFPNLDDAEIAIFNISEFEGTENATSSSECKVRDSLYRLYFNSLPKVVDLGHLMIMSTRKETFDLIEEVCSGLIFKGIIPVIVGGGQDISYSIYKAYAKLERAITLCSIDSNFNLGLADDKLKSLSLIHI